jgi:multidrug efflux pump
MFALIDAAISRYRVVYLLIAFILVMGSVAYVSVPKESSPDVQIPMIYVSMTLEGVSPEDAERLLLRPMEKQLSDVEGVKIMKSEASEGFASVTLEFDAGFDADTAMQDVRAKVDEAKSELPADTDEPKVQEVNFSLFPVVNVILTGDVPERTLVQVARDLQDKLESLSPVLQAELTGAREEVLEIVIDPVTLEGYNISAEEVFNKVQQNNILVPAGELDNGQGRFSVKLPGLIETFRDLADVPIITKGEKVVTLKDVARIRRTFKDPQTYARVDGRPAIGLGVSKRTGANIIDTVAAVRAVVEREQKSWPKGIDVVFSQDTSNEIRSMLGDLENNVIFAVLLVLLSILVTMDIKSAFLVSLSVPISFLIGILFLAAFGYTLNIVVLFSLILASGMLVDATIVVCEYADRLEEQGVPARIAYSRAAKRMAWPVIASTATAVMVFLPLLFWPGVVGQFMKYMPITIIVTMTGALVMAMLFVPALGARMRRDGESRHPAGGVASAQDLSLYHEEILRSPAGSQNDAASEVGEDLDDPRPTDRFTLAYMRGVEQVLRRPGRFCALMCAGMVAVFVLFGTIGPGVEFFPDIEPENASLQIRARGNLSVDEMDALVRQVESRITPSDEVKIFYTRSGKLGTRDMPRDTIGIIQMEFVDWQKRRRANEILSEMKAKVADIPGIVVETAKQEQGPPSGKAVQLELRSRQPELIAPAVEKVLAFMNEKGGYTNIEDDRPIPEIVWEFRVDREKAGRNNISVMAVGQMIKLITNGIKVNEYRPDDADDEVDIVVRFPEEYRNLGQLARLRVYTDSGQEPITNFVQRTPTPSVGTIRRVDGLRVMNIKADVTEGTLPDAKVKELAKWIAEGNLPPGVEATFRGEDEDQREAQQFLTTAFFVAIFGMALMMVMQFNSIYYMVVIMSAVIFSTGGVFLGHLLTFQPFGIVMSGVGVIALAGVVVQNNIIFLDTYKLLRERGMAIREALIETGARRLRPIFLTAGTTVWGLIPMMCAMTLDFVKRDISFGAPSAQWWVQLSTAIAGGLTFATCLTLFFTPCLILLWESRTGGWWQRLRRPVRRR